MVRGGGRTRLQAHGVGTGKGGTRVEEPQFPYLVQSRGEGKIAHGVCVCPSVCTCVIRYVCECVCVCVPTHGDNRLEGGRDEGGMFHFPHTHALCKRVPACQALRPLDKGLGGHVCMCVCDYFINAVITLQSIYVCDL